MPAFVLAALPVRVIDVLLFTVSTVPMATLPVVFRIFPTDSCVVKEVPEPVTDVDPVEVVMVPERSVLGHAVALQLPVATEVIVAAKEEIAGETKLVMNKKQRKMSRVGFITKC